MPENFLGRADLAEQTGLPEERVETRGKPVQDRMEQAQGWQGQAEGGPEGEQEPAETTLTVTDHRTTGSRTVEYAGRAAFLREYGFDGQEPYFEYALEDGALQLELYYDEGTGIGCGIRYNPETGREPEGFLFNGSGNYRYYMDFMKGAGMEVDPYGTLSFDGSDGKGEVKDYQESATYREDGRLAHYSSQGWITYLTEEKEIQTLLEIDLSYREDGTLRERDYWHNSMVFGTWYCSRQSYYDERERLVYEHCYVTHGSMDYYYIYEEDEEPVYCLIIDHNVNLLCAELLEYHGMETEMIYGKIGPMLSGETENRYVAAVREAAREKGVDYDGCVAHTYAMDYDGDSVEEAFVIIGEEVDIEEYDIYHMSGDFWFVDSRLEAPVCLDRNGTYSMRQEFICQDGEGYLFLRYSTGIPWHTEIYTVRDHAPVKPWETSTYKYLNRQGQVIQVQDAYDGSCIMTNTGEEQDEEDWWWMGHSWKPYTYFFDHGELREIPAREATREEVERIAPLPDSFYEIAPETIRQFILRDNGELNVNMAEENEWREGETMIHYSYITYRLDEDGEWEYVEEQQGSYQIQFNGGKPFKP